jgi:hypothetical protein
MHRVSLTVGGGSPRKGRWIAGPALLLPLSAHASLLPPHLEEKLADILGIAVLFIVPLLAIAVFWIVHVLPEKIAEKKQHPQKHAIHTLCLLSLVFGGLLWPIAWLWAYTKPVGYKLAYGTDKHDDYFIEWGEKVAADPDAPLHDIALLHDELDSMAAKGPLSTPLQALRERLALRLAERRAAALEREAARTEAARSEAAPVIVA